MMPTQAIRTSDAPEFPALSQAIRYGNLLFVSGQVAAEPGTKRFVGPDIKAQTRQVLDNLRSVVEAGGGRLANVIKVTVFLCDMADFEAFNEVYLTYFDSHRPARSTVQVAGLVGPYTIEIEAVAEVSVEGSHGSKQ